MVGKWQRGELLLDVFDASVLPTFKFEVRACGWLGGWLAGPASMCVLPVPPPASRQLCLTLVCCLACAAQAGPSPYPELFTHLEHPSREWAAGERAVVSELSEFKAAFTYFTGGLFEGVDWSNMIVAGVRVWC
jgi:hypothetical protein